MCRSAVVAISLMYAYINIGGSLSINRNMAIFDTVLLTFIRGPEAFHTSEVKSTFPSRGMSSFQLFVLSNGHGYFH